MRSATDRRIDIAKLRWGCETGWARWSDSRFRKLTSGSNSQSGTRGPRITPTTRSATTARVLIAAAQREERRDAPGRVLGSHGAGCRGFTRERFSKCSFDEQDLRRVCSSRGIRVSHGPAGSGVETQDAQRTHVHAFQLGDAESFRESLTRQKPVASQCDCDNRFWYPKDFTHGVVVAVCYAELPRLQRSWQMEQGQGENKGALLMWSWHAR